MKKPDIQYRYIGAFDTHFGWETKYIRGKRTVVEAHNERSIAAMLQFAADWKPNTFIHGGDTWNCGPVSHWHKGKPILDENFRLKDELDLSDRLLFKPMDEILPRKGATKRLHYGNHCAWILDFIAANPGMEGLAEPENYLRLGARGYEIYSQGEISNLGKLSFAHGDTLMGRYGSKYPAATVLHKVHRSIRCGHCHTLDAATEETPVDVQDYHTAIVIPSLSTLAPAYGKNAPNRILNGFNFGEVLVDGTFNDFVMVIGREGFTWNSKQYRG